MGLRSLVCRGLVSWWGAMGLVAAAVVVLHVPAPSMAAAPGYEALPTPVRLMDTRVGESTIDGGDAGIGLLAAGSSYQLRVGGRGGIPVDAESVVLNITAVQPQESGYITAHARGTVRPLASNLNYQPGRIVGNTVIVPVGTGGDVMIFTRSATHLVVDVAGSFPTGTTAMLDAAARLMDTRVGETTIDGGDAGIGLRAAGSSYQLHVAGRAGIPADAESVVLNITAVQPLGPGYITAHARGTVRPLASNLNYQPGQIVGNTVIVPVGTGGDVTLFTRSATHLVVDVAGSLPAGTTAMLDAAARLVDTRIGETTIDGQDAGIGLRPIASSLQVHVAGRAGIPADASTAVLNITAVQPYSRGYVSLHPTGTARSLASNLNYQPGQIVGNTVLARIGAGGDVCIFTRAGTHLVVDVAGYLPGPPPPPAGPTCPPIVYGSPRPLGAGATVADINNAGIVVGTADLDSNGRPEAVWWPTLGGPQPVPGVPEDAQWSHAIFINDRNQVLVSTSSEQRDSDLFVIDLPAGHAAQLPSLEDVPALDGVFVSRPQTGGLNDRGEVVLNLVQGSHDPEGVVAVWDSATGVVKTHPELLDVSWANDINDLGHVVGVTHGDDDVFDAFYWDLDTNVMHSVEHGGFGIAWPRGVNDRGQMVGDVGSSPAFWPDRDAAPVSLSGSFGSHWRINEAGLIVGRRPSSDPTWWDMPAIWDSVSGQWLEFPIQWPGSIHAMNDAGQVVGSTGDPSEAAIWHPI